MTADDLVGLESALGITLPEAYRAAMLAYPLDPTDANSQIALRDDARAITAFNRTLRDMFPDDWREGYFAFGNSPCGDPFFFDLVSRSAAVWAWDHETHEIVQEAPDFALWVEIQRSFEAGADR